ncbi:MAG: hypothetical protein ABI782_11860, partial [Anaerolineaceae bacterium]
MPGVDVHRAEPENVSLPRNVPGWQHPGRGPRDQDGTARCFLLQHGALPCDGSRDEQHSLRISRDGYSKVACCDAG